MHEIQGSIASSLGTQDRAAPFHALTGKDTLELMSQFLVLSEQITNFACAYADVTSGHIFVRTDMTIELCHESLAELHHLVVALAADREVGAAFATAHRQGGQGVLERLFKSEELQDGEVHGRVEAQTALVRADGAVELYAVAEVHLHLAFVVNPGHPERDDTLWFDDTLYDLGFLKLRMLIIDILD